MSRITVAGAGAFGTALAASLARDGRDVTLWARDARAASEMRKTRENARHLAGILLPENLSISADTDALATAETILLTVPTQKLRGFLNDHHSSLAGKTCVLCCKGIETGTGLLPAQILREILPDS
ncbi:MAG: 2-dehydropantoate 2-reductase N-terminal domain-containing protein, partial [Paracoccaceae bacterium]|nr:2-dehydropantoate 2-reductase N-terminal domain-containing protein [Paracoccaceae bacterium]